MQLVHSVVSEIQLILQLEFSHINLICIDIPGHVQPYAMIADMAEMVRECCHKKDTVSSGKLPAIQ